MNFFVALKQLLYEVLLKDARLPDAEVEAANNTEGAITKISCGKKLDS